MWKTALLVAVVIVVVVVGRREPAPPEPQQPVHPVERLVWACDIAVRATLGDPQSYRRTGEEGEAPTVAVTFEATAADGAAIASSARCTFVDGGRALWLEEFVVDGRSDILMMADANSALMAERILVASP